jgi:hypothetical protein
VSPSTRASGKNGRYAASVRSYVSTTVRSAGIVLRAAISRTLPTCSTASSGEPINSTHAAPSPSKTLGPAGGRLDATGKFAPAFTISRKSAGGCMRSGGKLCMVKRVGTWPAIGYQPTAVDSRIPHGSVKKSACGIPLKVRWPLHSAPPHCMATSRVAPGASGSGSSISTALPLRVNGTSAWPISKSWLSVSGNRARGVLPALCSVIVAAKRGCAGSERSASIR